jgi:hypothetical protein
MLFTPTALGFVCNSIQCRWQQEVWFCCIRFALCGTREYIKWLLPISLRWNGVWIVYFAHPYLTLNSPCRLYLFLSLFSFDDRLCISNKRARETSLANRVVLMGLSLICKIYFGFMNMFWTFSCGQQSKKSLLLYLRAALFSDPHFRFAESHGWDL